MRVLAVPGTPSSRTWPLLNRAMHKSSNAGVCPIRTRSAWRRISAYTRSSSVTTSDMRPPYFLLILHDVIHTTDHLALGQSISAT